MIKMNLQMPTVLANPKTKISRIIKNIYLIPGFFSPHTSLDMVSVGVYCVSRANDWSRLSNMNVNSTEFNLQVWVGVLSTNGLSLYLPIQVVCRITRLKDWVLMYVYVFMTNGWLPIYHYIRPA